MELIVQETEYNDNEYYHIVYINRFPNGDVKTRYFIDILISTQLNMRYNDYKDIFEEFNIIYDTENLRILFCEIDQAYIAIDKLLSYITMNNLANHMQVK